jgi:hypothetical protein
MLTLLAPAYVSAALCLSLLGGCGTLIGGAVGASLDNRPNSLQRPVKLEDLAMGDRVDVLLTNGNWVSGQVDAVSGLGIRLRKQDGRSSWIATSTVRRIRDSGVVPGKAKDSNWDGFWWGAAVGFVADIAWMGWVMRDFELMF